jgi:hypothetical protein
MSDDGWTQPTFLAWSWQVTNYSTVPDPDQPAPAKALSWVRCSVEKQPGAMVRLTPVASAAEQAAYTAAAGSRPDYGPFFCELGPLPAGQYVLTVEGIDASVPLWLDGSASASVAFVPVTPAGPPEPIERIPHVLLLGQMMAHQGNFLALTRYVARFGAVVTFDPQEAAQAEHVIIVGSTQLVSKVVEQHLMEAGVRVERAQGDIAAQLDGSLGAGTPFLTDSGS